MSATDEIKERIALIRREKNLTQEELALTAGVSKGTVSRWESGEIRTLRIDKVKRIAEAYGYNPMWIMGFDVGKLPHSAEALRKIDIIDEKLSHLDERQIDKVIRFMEEFL